MIDYQKLLTEYGLWPLEKWHSFEFVHQTPSDQIESDKKIKELSSEVNMHNGVYIYFKDKECLYVGKGAPIINRLKDHYRKSYEPFSEDAKFKRWHEFFSSQNYRGRLIIYWMQIEEEVDRQIFEKAINALLCPSFDRFPKR